jgi:hypothetical protein
MFSSSPKFSIVVYYISPNKLCIQDLKKYYKSLPGFIEVVNHPKERSMYIIDLQSIHPGNEYATHLMIHACEEARKMGITSVNLDDCSSRYRSPHNIYTKLGMKYEDYDGGPEMSGKIDDIIRCKNISKTDAPVIFKMNL